MISPLRNATYAILCFIVVVATADPIESNIQLPKDDAGGIGISVGWSTSGLYGFLNEGAPESQIGLVWKGPNFAIGNTDPLYTGDANGFDPSSAVGTRLLVFGGGLRVFKEQIGLTGEPSSYDQIIMNGSTALLQRKVYNPQAASENYSLSLGSESVRLNSQISSQENFVYVTPSMISMGTTGTPQLQITSQEITVPRINATEVIVTPKWQIAQAPPDYVFSKDYNLKSLGEVEAYIEKHGHLEEIPSAKAMKLQGINMADMNMLLLKKVEELTLHVIELNKKISLQQEQMNQMTPENKR